MKTIILKKLDISKPIAHHLIGEQYTSRHRKCIGASIMVVGVGLVQASHTIDVFIIHFACDVIGYAIHGLGAIPFISSIEKSK